MLTCFPPSWKQANTWEGRVVRQAVSQGASCCLLASKVKNPVGEVSYDRFFAAVQPLQQMKDEGSGFFLPGQFHDEWMLLYLEEAKPKPSLNPCTGSAQPMSLLFGA